MNDPKQMIAELLAKNAKLEKRLAKLAKAKANVLGGSGEKSRGEWCSPKKWTDRLGSFRVDPFSNERSHVTSDHACWLERGDNGLEPGEPGTYRTGGKVYRATEDDTSFIQPPYEIVLEAIAHYGHTRFCALLRFDPSTEWFSRLYRLTALVAIPRGERFEFEAPPGVTSSKNNPFPHAFYYARAEDAPTAILRSCFAWRTR